MTNALKDKIFESLTSILPIALIVMGLSIILTPLETGTFVLFIVGGGLLMVGGGSFMVGGDLAHRAHFLCHRHYRHDRRARSADPRQSGVRRQ